MNSLQQHRLHEVSIVGTMKDVMWKGALGGKLALDTVPGEHLYGLGPMEYLKGELLVLDGHCYRSAVSSDGSMMVTETRSVRAPFFGYAHVARWKEQDLPHWVSNIEQLEDWLDCLTGSNNRPFLFRLEGKIDSASIHVVNLPEGKIVKSPADAHQGQASYLLGKSVVSILGFFSRKHQSVFTHHDTYLHLHLITADRRQMGHLDRVLFSHRELKLLLPVGL